MPYMSVRPEGIVHLENLRDFRHRTADDIDETWFEDRFDLGDLHSLDYIVVPFANWRGLAHVFVSFGFADGRHLAISIEARRTKKGSYSPVRGLFRNYELVYVVGLERDLIGVRVSVRENPVYVYPVKTNNVRIRALFLSLMRKANRLHAQPEFYNTLTNHCTSSVVIPVNEMRDNPVSLLDYRLIFPGFSDELALDLGLLDTDLDIHQARDRFLVNDRAEWLDDPKLWSARLRNL